MELKPVKRVVVHEVVLKQITRFIRDNNLEPGTQLPPERDLAATFGVSRGSVREALKTLAGQGLVEIRHGQGVFVAGKPEDTEGQNPSFPTVSKELILELAEARILIETYAVQQLIEKNRISEAEIESLRRIAQGYLHGTEATETPSMAFELQIVKLTGNQVLYGLLKSVAEQWKRVWSELNATPLSVEARLEDHLSIIEALSMRDKELAVQLVRDHIASVSNSLNRFLK